MSNQPICKYYLQGYCRNGNLCKSLHPPPTRENRGYPASPNRVWLNPASRYEQDRHQSNQNRRQDYDYNQRYRDSYCEQYRDAYNQQYRDAYNQQYRDAYTEQYRDAYNQQYRDSYNQQYRDAYNQQYRGAYHESQKRGFNSRGGNDSGRPRHQKENSSSSAKSSSGFSFTKALNSVQSNSATGQSSLQQRVKQTGPASTATSFSFVKTLQEKVGNVPRSASGDGGDFYSKLEDLTKEQKSQFQASEFSWGKIPLMPPSTNFC